MMHRFILVCLSFFFVSGCTNHDLITIPVVIKNFKTEGLELKREDENCGEFELEGIMPSCFKNGEKGILYIYQLKSINDGQKALVEFDQYREQYNMVIPQIFHVRNIVILYFTDESRTDPFQQRDQQILDIVYKVKLP